MSRTNEREMRAQEANELMGLRALVDEIRSEIAECRDEAGMARAFTRIERAISRHDRDSAAAATTPTGVSRG